MFNFSVSFVFGDFSWQRNETIPAVFTIYRPHLQAARSTLLLIKTASYILYIYICIHTYIHIHNFIHIHHTFIYTNIRTYMYIHSYTHQHLHIYIHTCRVIVHATCQKNAISSLDHCTTMCTQVTFQPSYSLAYCTFADVTLEPSVTYR